MEERIQFSADDLELSSLLEDDCNSLSNFSCGSQEIDNFFHNEVYLCSKYRYLSPYKCTLNSSREIVGLFTLANDTLKLEYDDRLDFPNMSPEYSDIFRRQCTYPAINIGHLAVKKEMQSLGIGKFLVEFVIESFLNYRTAGCQFVTVDALNNIRTIKFYNSRLGFEFQTVYDLGAHTRRMYLDLFTAPVLDEK